VDDGDEYTDDAETDNLAYRFFVELHK
jgi:hypothetical protein